jgi:hypothetical protein
VSLLKKNYILLPIFNSDELVMSRGNRKKITYTFCKSGALQLIITKYTYYRRFSYSAVDAHESKQVEFKR